MRSKKDRKNKIKTRQLSTYDHKNSSNFKNITLYTKIKVYNNLNHKIKRI